MSERNSTVTVSLTVRLNHYIGDYPDCRVTSAPVWYPPHGVNVYVVM